MQQAPQEGAPAQPQQRQGIAWGSILWQVVVIWLLFNYFSGSNNTTEVPETLVNPNDPSIDLDTNQPPPDLNPKVKGKHYTLFPRGEAIMQIFVTESHRITEPILEKRVTLGGTEENNLYHFDVPITPSLLSNQTESLVVILVKPDKLDQLSKYCKDGQCERGSRHIAIYEYPLIHYQLQTLFVERQNLITGEISQPDLTRESIEERKIVSYWKPNITVSIVNEFSHFQAGSIPPQMKEKMQFYNDKLGYYPILYFNDFWSLHENYLHINDTLTTLPLTIQLETLSTTWFMLYEQLSQSLNMQKQFGSSDKDIDDLKLMLLDTNPYGLTLVISLLHTVFDVLAFKNDIQYWKNKKTMEGISVRTIFMNVISQAIIFLYLLDNDTSFLILVSVGIGILIEAWKITKAGDVTIDRSGIIPKIKFANKPSYSSTTKKYDELAFKYLGYMLFPMVIGYSIYSLYFETHKGWYSWVIASLTGCVYTFGFIMMTPQLFINYKLKSVAHLPWRTFTYKALNTFIDDLFAFIIRMPTLHRLSCFRDDIVFFIFLFQLWIYPKDPNRNEYGHEIGEEEEKAVEADVKAPVAPKGKKTKTAKQKSQ